MGLDRSAVTLTTVKWSIEEYHRTIAKAKVRQAKSITLPQSNSEPQPNIAIAQRLGQDYKEHHPYPENIFWL